SVGLFKLCYEFGLMLGAERQIVCSKAERLWTYQTLGFEGTGITTCYEKLNGTEHELLRHDFQALEARVTSGATAGNPFDELWANEYDEVVVPETVPALGLVDELTPEYKIAVGA